MKMYQRIGRALENIGPMTEDELLDRFCNDEQQEVFNGIKILEDNGAVSIDDANRYHFCGW